MKTEQQLRNYKERRRAEMPGAKNLDFNKNLQFRKKSFSWQMGNLKKKGQAKEERRVNALALGAEERRDKLRKAAGSCK